MAFVDKTLTCRECGASFAFTAGEQQFYVEKGLLNEPQRCPNCRDQRRRQREGLPTRELYPVVCARCGQQTTVPFVPRGDRPVYCNTCFQEVRAAGGR